MTTRTINRELIVHNDLAIGNGTVLQTRGTYTAIEQQIELEFIFRTTDEIRYLDVSKYTRTALHTEGPLVKYFFDSSSNAVDDDDSVLAPIPAIPLGRWIKLYLAINNDSLEYESIADLVADLGVVPTLAPYARAIVLGYHIPGDKGGGTFYWDNASTDSDDGGITFLPTGHTGAGRWKRVITDIVNVHHFGAVGDNVTNDRVAFENAFKTTSDNALVLGLKDLSYDVDGLNITLTNNLRILGVGAPLLYNGNVLILAGLHANIRNMDLIGWQTGIVLAPTGLGTYNFEQFGAVNCMGVSADSNVVIHTLRVHGGYFNGEMQAAYLLPCAVSTANISGIKIDNITYAGQDIAGLVLGSTQNPCDKIMISNCEIDGMTANDTCKAISVTGTEVIISDNIIKNLTSPKSEAIDASVSNSIITSNTLIDCGVSSGLGWLNCYFTNAVVSGINNNIIITDNVLQGTDGQLGEGIYLSGSGTIANNRISGNALGRGITLNGLFNESEYIVTGNHINCPAATQGIFITDDAQYSIISDNRIIVDHQAIRVDVLTISSFRECSISNNYLRADHGIVIDAGTDLIFDSNLFYTAVSEISGNYQQGWWLVDGTMGATSVLLSNDTSPVNVMPYKVAGLMVWDETNDIPVYAIGSANTSNWVHADGTVAYSPV